MNIFISPQKVIANEKTTPNTKTNNENYSRAAGRATHRRSVTSVASPRSLDEPQFFLGWLLLLLLALQAVWQRLIRQYSHIIETAFNVRINPTRPIDYERRCDDEIED